MAVGMVPGAVPQPLPSIKWTGIRVSSRVILEATGFSKDTRIQLRYSICNIWRPWGRTDRKPEQREARRKKSRKEGTPNSRGFSNYWHGCFCKGPCSQKEKGFISWLLSLLEKPELPQISVGWIRRVKRKTEATVPFSNTNEHKPLQNQESSRTEHQPFTSWELRIPSPNLLSWKWVSDTHQMPTAGLYLLWWLHHLFTSEPTFKTLFPSAQKTTVRREDKEGNSKLYEQ